MAVVATFTFNPFQENTYLIYDDSKECIIIDPGCSNAQERDILSTFIKENSLKPMRLINTHCHIDHVLGNQWVSDHYNLGLEIHRGEIPVLEFAQKAGDLYGIPYDGSPAPVAYIEEGDEIIFGQTLLSALLTPGHSPASISLFCKEDQFLIAGDVLFQGSIGRTDLPGGDFDTLISSIKDKLFPLGDTVRVYPGHGPYTSIGEEKKSNPFLT